MNPERRQARWDAKFERLVQRGAANACWPWLGGLDDDGYGRIRMWPKTVRSHRLAWEKANGRKLRRSELVCHSCDFRACMNPAHFFLGTPAKNSADMVAKGRQAKGNHVPSERRVRGEQHPASKLRTVDVRRIRRLIAAGDSVLSVSRRFGISWPVAKGIATGKGWAHVA